VFFFFDVFSFKERRHRRHRRPLISYEKIVI